MRRYTLIAIVFLLAHSTAFAEIVAKQSKSGARNEVHFYEEDSEMAVWVEDGTNTIKIGKRLNGTVKFYNDKDVLEVEVVMKNDELDGLVKGWKNGKIFAESIYQSGKLISQKNYNENGTLEQERDEVKGLTIDYFPNGKIKNEIKKKNGKLYSKKEFFESGILSGEFIYNQGKIEQGKEYFENGKLESAMNLVNGDGVLKIYNEGGNVIGEVPYKNYKQNGIEKDFSESGKLFGIKTYKNGKLDGELKMYNENGIIKLSSYYENDKEMWMKTYDEKGRLVAFYKYIEEQNSEKPTISENPFVDIVAKYEETVPVQEDRMKDCQYKLYYHDGTVESEGYFKKGLPEGLLKGYYSSGKIKSFKNYINGKEDGQYKVYYEDGKLAKKGTYKDGIKEKGISYFKNGKIESEFDGINGIGKAYSEDGKLLSSATYDKSGIVREIRTYYDTGKISAIYEYKTNDGREKTITGYDENGNIECELKDKDGKLDGLQRNYYENGEIRSIETFKKGVKVNAKKYDTIGSLIMNQDYPYEETQEDKSMNANYLSNIPIYNSRQLAALLPTIVRNSFVECNEFKVIERDKLQEILGEQKLSLSGVTVDNDTKIGQMLGADYMIFGTVKETPVGYLVDMRMVRVEDGEIIGNESEEINKTNEFVKVSQKASKDLIKNYELVVKDRKTKKVVAIMDFDDK